MNLFLLDDFLRMLFGPSFSCLSAVFSPFNVHSNFSAIFLSVILLDIEFSSFLHLLTLQLIMGVGG